jgi:ketosteroid isomerase-like protein
MLSSGRQHLLLKGGGGAMSSNVEAVKAIYARFGQGDIPGVLEQLDPDVEWEHDWGAEPLPLYKPRHGRQAVAGFFAALADFDFLRFEPVAFLDGDDMVAVAIRTELRHKGSGREFRDLEMHLWTFGPDGLVKRFRHMADTHQLAGVIGAS